MILVLVAGGRDFSAAALIARVLARIERDNGPITIMHGACGVDALDMGPWSVFQGADGLAHTWAAERGRKVHAVPACWSAQGRSAGPRRNARMLEMKPDLVIAFHGGRGTADMVDQARRAGVPVIRIMKEDR